MYKYEVLIRYIKLFFEKNALMSKDDAELILIALEGKEKENE